MLDILISNRVDGLIDRSAIMQTIKDLNTPSLHQRLPQLQLRDDEDGFSYQQVSSKILRSVTINLIT